MPVEKSRAQELVDHLQTATTNVCRCWKVTRRDGVVLGFTDHDETVSFDGTEYLADSGMSAGTLVQTTGLAVDNSEALGALTSGAITEADISAGRYDDAEVQAWIVNWKSPGERLLQFSGTLGEVTQRGGTFQTELRGLAEALNRPQGFVYQKPCSAVLGDGKCRLDMDRPDFTVEAAVSAGSDGRLFTFLGLGPYALNWFERGRAEVLSGQAAGLVGIIKADRIAGENREIELWQSLRAPLHAGDVVRLQAGCDKLWETCREKFSNTLNFRGFPHIPGEDWLTTYPKSSDENDGGSAYGNDSSDW